MTEHFASDTPRGYCVACNGGRAPCCCLTEIAPRTYTPDADDWRGHFAALVMRLDAAERRIRQMEEGPQ